MQKREDAEATEAIFMMYRPLLFKEICSRGVFDEGLYQELSIRLLRCIRGFRI